MLESYHEWLGVKQRRSSNMLRTAVGALGGQLRDSGIDAGARHALIQPLRQPQRRHLRPARRSLPCQPSLHMNTHRRQHIRMLKERCIL